jgi:hypothetical protein
MKKPGEIGKAELKELLHKNWMTHDGMWFLHSLEECGIEKTNTVNLAAVRSMGLIEIRRIQKLLGVEKIENFGQLEGFFENIFVLYMPKFMKFRVSYPERNVIRVEWEPEQCFAYQGIRKLGVIDRYKCGIYTRIESWLDGLGLKYEYTPKFEACVMPTRGECHRDYKIDLPG